MVLFAETDRSFRDALSDTTERVTVTGTTVHGRMIPSTPLGKTERKRHRQKILLPNGRIPQLYTNRHCPS